MGHSPTGGLWVIALVVAAGTIGVSWNQGAIAWPGVIATILLVVLIGVWSSIRGWSFWPW